nr:MAG TPA: hypothetical protein [Caudoviricetes sp.]
MRKNYMLLFFLYKRKTTRNMSCSIPIYQVEVQFR